jgi:hypothetical protein
MNIKKITKKIEKYATKSYFQGYNSGYENAEVVVSEEAFTDGSLAEQERIQTVLDMHIQWALESGKGSEVVMLNRVKEMITPIVITEDHDTF